MTTYAVTVYVTAVDEHAARNVIENALQHAPAAADATVLDLEPVETFEADL